MNGVISLSDGQGTVIQDGSIQTGNIGAGSINANTVIADNLLQADEDEVITGAWEFETLPYSALAPNGDFELSNKIYVDDSITGVVGNFVDLTTAQTIGGVKTFSDIPKSAGVPSANDDVVNKLYVDNSVITDYVTTDTTQTITGEKAFVGGLKIGKSTDPTQPKWEFDQVGDNLSITHNSNPVSAINISNTFAGGYTDMTLDGTLAVVSGVRCSTVPTLADELCNKTYVDNHLSGSYVDLTTNQTVNGIKNFGSLTVNESQTVFLKNTEFLNFADFDSFAIANATYAGRSSNPAVFQSNAGLTQIGGTQLDFKVSDTVRVVLDSDGTLEQDVKLANGNAGVTQNIIIDKKGSATNRNLASYSSDNMIIGDGCFLTGGGNRNIAIGKEVLQTSNGQDQVVAIGYAAAKQGIGSNCIAVGTVAMGVAGNATSNCVAVGGASLYSCNTIGVVGVGANSAQNNPQRESVSIGFQAGQSNAGQYSTSVGVNAGQHNAGAQTVNVGGNSGHYSAQYSVNLGFNTGMNSGYGSVSMGHASNQQGGQQGYSINIGFATAQYGSLQDDINMGTFASRNAISSGRTQGRNINLGYNAGNYANAQTGADVISIGMNANINGTKGTSTISIGRDAGYGNGSGTGGYIGERSIAIGHGCLGNGVADDPRGTASGTIAIGFQCGWYDAGGAGHNSIGLNGWGARSLEMPNNESFYVKPIRNISNEPDSNFPYRLFYSPNTGEIGWKL
tara:strand:- start:400 stop:2601 length:2202 start_codon:yes stop_codon:yes gene_type:complete